MSNAGLLGRTIGHIRVVDRLGEGGMGEVYVGYDTRLDRKVAVKAIHGERGSDEELKLRLLHEARILSRLGHPGICQIHGLVEEGDVRLIVLELIAGANLKRHIAAGVSRREGLRVAIDIAEALASAHAQGVVHRDLKPANVMIAEGGAVKVLDFGIARSLEDEERTQGFPFSPGSIGALPSTLTQTGTMVGTPESMSPEQARGEPVTPAADMYAFGLLLQHLFTGEPPYPRGMPAYDLVPKVASGWSRPVEGLPRALTSLIESLKALEPGQRPPATVAAARLRAIRDAPGRRLRRAAAVAAALVVVGGVAKYVLDLRAKERAVSEARAQAEELHTFLLDDLHQKLAPVGRLDLLEEVSQKTLAYFDRLPPEQRSASDARLGAALRNLGEVRVAQGRFAEAQKLYGRAVEVDSTGVAAGCAPCRVSLAEDQIGLGTVHAWRGETMRAQSAYEQALTLLADTPRADDDPTLMLRHAKARQGLATALGTAGERAAAISHSERAMELVAAVYAQHPRTTDIERTYADQLTELAGTLRHNGRPEAARARFDEAVALANRLLAENPEDFRRMRLKVEVAYSYGLFLRFDAEDSVGAEKQFLQAIDLARRLVKANPDDLGIRYRLAVLIGQGLGTLRANREDYASARAASLEASAILRELLSRNPANARWTFAMAWELRRLGNAEWQLGKRAEALRSYRQALDLYASAHRRDPNNATWAQDFFSFNGELGDHMLNELGEPGDAMPLLLAARDGFARLHRFDPADEAVAEGLTAARQSLARARLALSEGARTTTSRR